MQMGKPRVAAVLPAGGCGERMGVSTPKQFCTILGRPLISYTLQAFERVSWIKEIVVVVVADQIDLMQSIIHKYGHKRVILAQGGTARHRSILNGLKLLAASESSQLTKPDVVIIHDAVRPFVEEDVLLKVMVAANEHGAAGVVRPLVSTIIASTEDACLHYSLDRASHRASEMPQAFQFDAIFQAYLQCSNHDLDFGTECLQLALKYSNKSAKLVEGPSDLWKVTYSRDLFAAESLIKDELSQHVCLVTEMREDAVQVGFLLHDALKAQGKQVKGISPSLCKNVCQVQTLFKGKACYNFICINKKESGFEETQQVVDVLGNSSLPVLYPVLLVSVHLFTPEDPPFGSKLQELAAIREVSMEAKKKNIWVYGLVIHLTKVEQQLQETVGRGTAIITALIKDRCDTLTGQLLVA
ncbi:D-ribitol-5-phosphate cytidylyltransferase [Ambystoma mexicanum]|uniref:D-ribitol-5-phosphate cytidylyltransferase n=1 Tax=Ambystoma mexicanum TaxID=8296 RepID=UPI0037E7DFFD